MHIPDGFVNGSTALATGAVGAAAVGYSLKVARERLDDRQIPMLGVTAAFVFAAQMINFPVGLGTSGHLLGGALAAVLLGPWLGGLVIAIVLMVQAIGFADGGITALGANVTWAYLAALGGWAIHRALTSVLPRSRPAVAAAAGVSAFLTVVGASAYVAALISWGGPFGVEVWPVMVGLHTLIGLGEAAITAAVVAAVLATRPDLCAAADRVAIVPVGSLEGV